MQKKVNINKHIVKCKGLYEKTQVPVYMFQNNIIMLFVNCKTERGS